MLKEEQDLPFQTNDFPRSCRLHSRNTILEIVRNGDKVGGKSLWLRYIKSEPTGFAVSVGKSYGKAVRRNRIKRLIREYLRQNKDRWPQNRQVLISISGKNKNDNNQSVKEKQIIEELEFLLSCIK